MAYDNVARNSNQLSEVLRRFNRELKLCLTPDSDMKEMKELICTSHGMPQGPGNRCQRHRSRKVAAEIVTVRWEGGCPASEEDCIAFADLAIAVACSHQTKRIFIILPQNIEHKDVLRMITTPKSHAERWRCGHLHHISMLWEDDARHRCTEEEESQRRNDLQESLLQLSTWEFLRSFNLHSFVAFDVQFLDRLATLILPGLPPSLCEVRISFEHPRNQPRETSLRKVHKSIGEAIQKNFSLTKFKVSILATGEEADLLNEKLEAMWTEYLKPALQLNQPTLENHSREQLITNVERLRRERRLLMRAVEEKEEEASALRLRTTVHHT